MPESMQDRELDQLLGYRDTVQADAFILGVMHRVQRERRSRRVILAVFGLIGAVFGMAGALLLSEPIARVFTSLPLTGTMQAVLVGVAGVAFYGWAMNEDISLDT